MQAMRVGQQCNSPQLGGHALLGDIKLHEEWQSQMG